MLISHENIVLPQELYNVNTLNLNQFFLQYRQTIPSVQDPQYLNRLLRRLRGTFIGGYGEDRSDIWKGTYLDNEPGYVHLGVDIIHPTSGVLVLSPIRGKVIDVFDDRDTKIGWGGRVILQTHRNKPYIIFAHLDPNSIDVQPGQKIDMGTLLGRIGKAPTNGNTFEHLHLQLRYSCDFDTMDGYGTKNDLFNNPDPFTTHV